MNIFLIIEWPPNFGGLLVLIYRCRFLVAAFSNHPAVLHTLGYAVQQDD